jgi:6-pyruvoyltetrahydropterin/6-carboxytetrahydropterin synthase
MFEVSVEDTFAAGHALRGYRGKCENPHGHNYKVQVTLKGESLDNIGLLFDFKDLKLAMNDIIDRLDHKFINDIDPFTELNPSAENMAKYFYDEINVLLRDKTSGRVQVKLVKMWETDTTVATYFE